MPRKTNHERNNPLLVDDAHTRCAGVLVFACCGVLSADSLPILSDTASSTRDIFDELKHDRDGISLEVNFAESSVEFLDAGAGEEHDWGTAGEPLRGTDEVLGLGWRCSIERVPIARKTTVAPRL